MSRDRACSLGWEGPAPSARSDEEHQGSDRASQDPSLVPRASQSAPGRRMLRESRLSPAGSAGPRPAGARCSPLRAVGPAEGRRRPQGVLGFAQTSQPKHPERGSPGSGHRCWRPAPRPWEPRRSAKTLESTATSIRVWCEASPGVAAAERGSLGCFQDQKTGPAEPGGTRWHVRLCFCPYAARTPRPQRGS